MRILHISPDYHPAVGGGELFIKEVSERLAARGHHVTVLAMNSRGTLAADGQELQRSEIINGVAVDRLNGTYRLHQRFIQVRGAHRVLALAVGQTRSRMLATTPCSVRAFLATLRTQVEVVSVVNWYHGSLAYQTALARGLRRFAFVGIPLFHTERPWAHQPLVPAMLARCDAVAAMTDYEKQFIETRSGIANAEVVGAGVDPARFVERDGARLRSQYGIGDAPVVGYIGRMSASKGVITLIRAMRILWRHHPQARLLLAGSGLAPSAKCDEDVRTALADLSADERRRLITIGGFTDQEKASIFDALDVFAMPSVAESFGIAYLEAWMCRKPVVGSRIGSTQGVISDLADGVLIPPDDPEALAIALGGLLNDRALRDRLGTAGFDKTVAASTWDQVALRVERLYQNARRDVVTQPSAVRTVA